MAQYVVSLSDAAARDPALAGSKGAALARMIKGRIPVPSGFVVTTDTFRSVTDGIRDDLLQLGVSRSTSENALKKASHHIRRLLLDASFPRGAASRIRAQWKAIGSPAVSVRSSSTAEDLADASFAGQYDSYLNVITFDDVLEKVKHVWASLHSHHAIGYRRRHGLSHEEAHMAVVVQTQLSPDAAGVMFTRDPVTGKNRVVISAALGLGEGVVSGSAQTDRFVLRPKSGAVISSAISEKKVRVDTSLEGGIEAFAVSADQANTPAVTDRQLKRLTTLGRTLIRLFGGPQDVEYATVDGAVQILQSRPMTATEPEARPDVPWNKGVNRKHTWHRRGGPFYRLEEDATLERLKHMKDCYDEVGSSMTANHVGHAVNGYLYVRANEVGERTLKKRHKSQTARVERSLKKGKSYFEDVLQEIIVEQLETLRKQRSNARSLTDQVEYLAACIVTMGYVQGNLHWRQGKPKGRGSWHKEFSEITGRPENEANVYVQAIQNRMTRVITWIRELARFAKSDRVLKRIFLERDFDALSDPRIASREKTQAFRSRFKAMMRVYGIRAGHGYGTGSRFATPTWNLDHEIPFEFIATYIEQDLNRLDRIEKSARRERDNATARMRRQLAAEPEKLAKFNEALAEARIGVRFLEDHNYYMEQCTIGTMREAIHGVGTCLVERGQIDAADDVFHFSIQELKQIAQRNEHTDLREQVVDRTEERERRKRMNAPAHWARS